MPGNKKFIFALMAVACGLSAINFFYGYAEDSDARILIERAWEFGTRGYGPSRNWGFPLYEWFAYPLLYYWGLGAAKFFSFLCYGLSGLILFYLVLFCTKDRWIAFFGSLAFLAHPLTIINSNSISESSMALVFSAASLWALAKFMEGKNKTDLWLTALLSGLAVATRQDYLMLAAAVGLTAFAFGTNPEGRRSFGSFAVAAGIFLFAVIGPYLFLYGFDHHLNTEFLKNDPYWRTLARAGFGWLSFLGWPVLLLSPLWFFFRKSPPRFVTVLFLLTLAFYSLRYSFNADKLEYILGALPVLILFLSLTLPRKALRVAAVAFFLPNLLQMHLFRREGRQTTVNIGFSPGVFAQEQRERLKQEYIFLGDHEAVLKEAAEKKFGCQKYITYLLEVEDENLCMVVQEERLRFWNPDRARVDVKQAMKKRIIVYPLPDHRGWRQWIRYEGWRRPTLEEFRNVSENR